MLLLGCVGYPVAPTVSRPCRPILDLAPVRLVWIIAPGNGCGAPAVAPGSTLPSGVATLLPGPRAVLLDQPVGVGAGGLPDLGDGPREPCAHWTAST